MPDEICDLDGHSSVGLSFEQPVETIESNLMGTLHLLEAIRFVGRPIKFYSSGSSECFGDRGSVRANEGTPFRPRRSYAVAKVCAYNQVANYREAYSMHASSGVLFHQESPLWPERFVEQKIIRRAARIASGKADSLTICNLDMHLDWGWAPEYVDAMWRMLQQNDPADCMIATGRSASLEEFVTLALRHFGLEWRKYVRHDVTLLRPSDIRFGAADPSLARQRHGWKSSVSLEDLIPRMCRTAEAEVS
jgi:GDPmannose 4,6-dehydratase